MTKRPARRKGKAAGTETGAGVDGHPVFHPRDPEAKILPIKQMHGFSD